MINVNPLTPNNQTLTAIRNGGKKGWVNLQKINNMTTQEKIKAVQDDKAMIDNDCDVEQFNKVIYRIFGMCREAEGTSKFYKKIEDPYLKWIGTENNFNNLPAIPASTFFDNDEPMINISVKRLEELAKDVSEYKHIYFQAGVKKLCDILKQEAR